MVAFNETRGCVLDCKRHKCEFDCFSKEIYHTSSLLKRADILVFRSQRADNFFFVANALAKHLLGIGELSEYIGETSQGDGELGVGETTCL